MPNALKGKTFRTLMQITASDSGKPPADIMVLPLGDWNTQFYGPMQVTSDHLTQIVANFKNNVRKLVPVDVDHDGGKAAGWVEEVRAEEDGLHAKVSWTPYGSDLLKNKEYRLFSPEWSFDYVDPEHGSRHGATLIAGSLTNRPLFKELPVLMASEGSSSEKGLTNGKAIMILLGSDEKSSDKNNMPTLIEILAKPVAERSAEDVKFLEENQAQLNDEQKTQLETEKTEADKAQSEADAKAKADAEAQTEKEKADAEAQAKAEADKAEADKVEAEKVEAERKANEGKTVTISANEHAEFLKAKEANIKMQSELRRVATEKEVSTLIANDKGGHILPKSKDAVVDMIMTFSDAQKKSFLEFVKAQPEIKIAGEQGGEGKALTAKEKLSNLRDEAVKASEGKLNKGDAMKQVMSENPELAKQYNEEL